MLIIITDEGLKRGFCTLTISLKEGGSVSVCLSDKDIFGKLFKAFELKLKIKFHSC